MEKNQAFWVWVINHTQKYARCAHGSSNTPWDLWLPVVKGSPLFAQRTVRPQSLHDAGTLVANLLCYPRARGRGEVYVCVISHRSHSTSEGQRRRCFLVELTSVLNPLPLASNDSVNESVT